MSAINIAGFAVIRDEFDTVIGVEEVTLTVVLPTDPGVLNYTVTGTDSGGLPIIAQEAAGTEPVASYIDGANLPETTTDLLGVITTSAGDHVVLVIEDGAARTEYIFNIGGDPLTYPTTPGEFATLDGDITGVEQATGTFAPNTDIAVTDMLNTDVLAVDFGTVGDDSLTGTAGPDVLLGLGGNDTLLGGDGNDTLFGGDGNNELIGGDGDDFINPGGGFFGGGTIFGGGGNDTIGFEDIESGFVALSYIDLTEAVFVTIDGAANIGSVDKGADGVDTLVNVGNVLATGWASGGLSGGFLVNGTSQNDTFILSPEGQQWMAVQMGDGIDTLTINGTGLVRLQFFDTSNGIAVNLGTGQIIDDGFGNSETIGGTTPLWEIFGSAFDDTLAGSAGNDSFRYFGGSNTIEGDGGFDRVSYDLVGLNIVADLASGTVAITTTDGVFTDTISGIEWVRGSNGADDLSDSLGDNLLEGWDGADIYRISGGVDTIRGFHGSDVLDVSSPGLSDAQIQSAFASAIDGDGGAVVDFGNGSTLTFEGLTAAQVQGLDPLQGSAGTIEIIGTANDDYLGGTLGNDQISGLGGSDYLSGGDGNDTLFGGDGGDTLIGGSGDDFINPGDNLGRSDIVIGGSGNDTISFVDIVEGFVYLDYSGLTTPISVTIDGAANTGTVDKGINGADTLVDVDNVLAAGWTIGGLGVNGTAQNDTFILSPEGQQWMAVQMGDGIDTLTINGTGLVRLQFFDTANGINVNLGTGQIIDDGFGNAETIGGSSPVWEILGSFYNDTVVGSAANESYRYFGGNNSIEGGDGIDRVRYDYGGNVTAVVADIAAGTVAVTTVYGVFTDTISGIEWVRGSSGGDDLADSSGNDRLEGMGGVDVYRISGGADTISGFQIGTDVLDVSSPGLSDAQIEAAFTNAVDGVGGAVIDFGNGSLLTFQGLTAAQVQGLDPFAGASTNAIIGTNGDDSLIGTQEGEFIQGLAGNDTLEGLGGDDTLLGGDGYDVLAGGSGDDFINPGGSDFDLGFSNADHVIGGSGNDTISFDFVGGSVRLDYSNLSAGISVSIDGVSNSGTIDKGLDGVDTLIDVASILTEAYFDTGGLSLYGTAHSDTFNLTLDTQQWLSIRMGAGVDTLALSGSGLFRLDFTDVTNGISINLGTREILNDGFGNSETIGGTAPVFEIFGSAFDDAIVGTSSNDRYRYFGGNNTFNGGDGVDRVRYDTATVAGITANLETGLVFGELVAGGNFTDTLTSIEWIYGSFGNDDLSDSSGDNYLSGGSYLFSGGFDGNDVFRISGGVDTIRDFQIGTDVLDVSSPGLSNAQIQTAFANAVDGVGGARVDFGNGSTLTFQGLTAAQVQGLDPLEGATGPNIIIGTAGDDSLAGTLLADDISGLGGNDFLSGSDGPDTLSGAGGADTLYGDAGEDILYGGAGSDTLYGGADNDTLSGGFLQDILYGEGGDDVLNGDEGLDTLFGGSGNDTVFGGGDQDTLFGGTGADLMDGGDGSDVYFVDALDTVQDSGTFGFDRAQINDAAGVALNSLAAWSGVERVNGFTGNDTLDATGATQAYFLFGNDGNDSLIGGNGVDTILGGNGDDVIFGGDGNDILQGGTGNDTFYGGAGNDLIYVGESGDVVADAGAGFDRVLINNAAGLSIQVGAWQGVERIVGFTGNDTIDATGATTGMIFGLGAGNDVAIGGSGNDTVYAGAGNDLMLGGAGDDALIGGNGNDTLNGGAGNDFLLGGVGADVFVFANGFGNDVIRDFTDGIDLIDFSAHTGIGSLSDLVIQQSGVNTIITLAATDPDQITLTNADAINLTAEDFIFA